jgi:hypothetical protein
MIFSKMNRYSCRLLVVPRPTVKGTAMNSFQIKSKIFGKVFTFYCGRGLSYITVSISDSKDIQICMGGKFNGNTIMSTPDQYENVSRKWYKNYIINYKSEQKDWHEQRSL